MGEYLEKFRNLFLKLFQLDQSPNEGGIFPLLAIKREQILSFLNVEIPQIIEEALEKFPDHMDNSVQDLLYTHLYSFFSRYSASRDLISAKKFSEQKQYHLPYNGQEIFLYWPTKDQYYVKMDSDTPQLFSDYFIHKNLGSFLQSELKDYIQSLIFRIENLPSIAINSDAKFQGTSFLITLFQSIATKIIVFLDQIEDLEKNLWEKKKFVLYTEFILTMDKIAEDLYPEILANEAQLHEWTNLYQYHLQLGIDDLIELKSHPFLPIDTKYFTQSFKEKVLASFMDIDDELNGILIQSDNFHALNLLEPKFRQQIKCIYIDPPYNTGSDEFLYKDNYQHSSWLTMIENRLSIAKNLLASDGLFFSSIDDNEQPLLSLLLKEIFGYLLPPIIWHEKTQPSFLTKKLFPLPNTF